MGKSGAANAKDQKRGAVSAQTAGSAPDFFILMFEGRTPTGKSQMTTILSATRRGIILETFGCSHTAF
jgi:hypothetical protein